MSKKIQIYVMRAAPFTLAPIYEWKEIDVGGIKKPVKGKTLHKKHVLQPGGGESNMVDVDHWQIIKKRTTVVNFIKHGFLAEADRDDKVPANLDPGQLITYQSIEEAKAAVELTTSLSRLGEFHTNDSRPEVKEAVLKRLKILGDKEKPETSLENKFFESGGSSSAEPTTRRKARKKID